MRYQIKRDKERVLFESFVGENLSILASGNRLKERVSYIEKRNEVLGVKTQNKDERTGDEIIADTFRKFGITLTEADK